MSLEFDQLKSAIDDLDFELNGNLWTIAGVTDIESIKEEIPLNFENVNDAVVELTIRAKDFPLDFKTGTTAIDQLNNRLYVISKALPEADGVITLWLNEYG